MASLELYINKQLCEIENPENFSIYLKRQLLNPAELSTKDAQRSYDISLPATATNNAIFGYTNTEEVKGKFSQLYDAQLLANGTKIFDGKFKISEIGKDYYKGNLGIPAAKTVKDIFGEMKMNQAGKWLIPFEKTEDMTSYNTDVYSKEEYGDNSPCIFPFVLYGLLPKTGINGIYTDKNIYDETVVLGLKNFPASINCMHMLRKLFTNAGYSLTGTAIDDKKLQKLYVSYKNPDKYEMPEKIGNMRIKAKWGNLVSGIIEPRRYQNLIKDQNQLSRIAVNIFNSRNITNVEIDDLTDNITKTVYPDRTTVKFRIPQSGLYKIRFNAHITLKKDIGSLTDLLVEDSTFRDKYEFKVVRNYTEELYEKDIFDNTFYRNNLGQDIDDPNIIYPQADGVNFIDPKQNPNFICGFSWGYNSGNPDYLRTFYNPVNTSGIRSNPMAITGGESWSIETGEDPVNYRAYSAVKSKGYIHEDKSPANRFIIELDSNKENIYPSTTQIDDRNAEGKIDQIIWLEKDDVISIIGASVVTFNKILTSHYWLYGNHEVDFDLSIEPFIPYKSWLKVNAKGSSSETMNWDEPVRFDLGQINLIKFLPSEIKVNDWIDNFCKVFNLNLINIGIDTFELNVKQNSFPANLSNIIDLDTKVNINRRTNQSLKLPHLYEIGFTADTSEIGYYESINDYVKNEDGSNSGEKAINSGYSGGGKHYTDSIETTVVGQKSNFSYCWYKKIENKINNLELNIPVIMEQEAWEKDYDYQEFANKSYFNKAQRFWFKTGLFDAVVDGKVITLVLAGNEYKDSASGLILNYENESDTIMKQYFFLFGNHNNDYTIVDCFLTPEEYVGLQQSFIKFNGDLYNVAEIDGYDPTGRKQGTLKLIRQII